MQRTQEAIYEELLVLDAQNGNLAALEELAGRWRPRLVRHAMSLVDEADAAEDIAQESLLSLARGLRSVSDPAAFPTWAYRIATRRCADFIRKERRRKRALKAAEQNARQREDPPVDDGDASLLRAALRRLAPERRALLALHHVDGLGVREIGRILEIPTGTVKSRLSHARRALLEEIERMSDEQAER